MMIKSIFYLSYCRDDCQPHVPFERHRQYPPLLAVVPIVLAALTLVSLAGYGEPFYQKDGVTNIKSSSDVHSGQKDPLLMIHKGLLASEERLSAALLCRPDLFVAEYDATWLSEWTTNECFDKEVDGSMISNAHVRPVASLKGNNSDWVDCASHYNQSDLLVAASSAKIDSFEPSCPSYPEPSGNEQHVLLKVPMRNYVSNIFHLMVIRGRPLWCILDAVTRFAAKAKAMGITWTVEFTIGPDMHGSRYAKNLFRALSSDVNVSNQDSVTEYELQGNLSLDEHTLVAKHGVFWPNTRYSEWLSDTSKRASLQVLDSAAQVGDHAKTTRFDMEQPFVLLVLRSTTRRRLAGAETGTATEIVLTLLEQSLPVYVLDSALATIEDQIYLFKQATVVVSMHGAGLTNLVWMRPNQSAVIEVAASYGWAKYIDKKGSCSSLPDEPGQYKKGGYYNLARRFGVRYELIHPMYASRPATWPQNPAGKWLYYADANELADLTARVFQETVTTE